MSYGKNEKVEHGIEDWDVGVQVVFLLQKISNVQKS